VLRFWNIDDEPDLILRGAGLDWMAVLPDESAETAHRVELLADGESDGWLLAIDAATAEDVRRTLAPKLREMYPGMRAEIVISTVRIDEVAL
jgi:hypothetical protein